MKKTILLVDDHPVFRQGLHSLLEKEKGLKVVGEAEDGQVAIDLAHRLSPDIVVMDISMPNLDGIEATRRIMSESPDTRIVALSVHSGKRFVNDMFQAGASGYILKESVPEEMIEGIRTVLAGDVYLSKSISGIVVSEYKKLLSEIKPVSESPLQPILRTKLHPPPISADIIPRTRLIELLEDGRHRAMTLISAPAGYGKSILASQWLETCQCPGAWLSLDKNDNDLRVFLNYLLEAIQKAFPEASLDSKSLLQGGGLPPVKSLTRHLLNDIEQVDEPFILVLDDYHHISAAGVHDLLIELLRYPSPMMHLTLLVRRDPPLPISALRAGGHLTEITMEHLRFSPAETAGFLDRFLHVSIDQHTASVLEERLEGWVTGLRLTALSVGQREDFEGTLRRLEESPHYVQEYLIQEVLSEISPDFSRYLMETSILDRFSAPLCDALHLLNREQEESADLLSGKAFIDWLEKTHLFVIALDDTQTWFRYHNLFQQLVENQLERHNSSEEIAALHSKASVWFSENGFIDDAIKHALASDNIAGAAELVDQNRQDLLNHDKWFILENWLAKFPETFIQKQPGLLLARVWVLYHRFDIPAIPSVIDAAESLLGKDPSEQPLRGEIDFFRGYICYFQNEGSRSLKHLNSALKKVPESYREIRGQIEILHGLATQMAGQKDKALDKLNDLVIGQKSSKSITKTRLLVTLVYIHIISGELDKALAANQQLYGFSKDNSYEYARVWSVYLRGLIHFFQHDLDSAIDQFSQAIEQKYNLHTRAVVDSMAGLAYAYRLKGQSDQAGDAMQFLDDYVDQLNDPAYSTIARLCHARMSIMKRAPQATNRLRGNPPPPENMVWWLEIPAVTYCRVLLAIGTDAGLQEAEEKLQEYFQLNEANHNTCHMIHVMLILSMTYTKQERVDEALAILERAIELAEPGRWIFPFVELGPPMADLLKQLRKKNVSTDYIDKILTAFSENEMEAGPHPLSPSLSRRSSDSEGGSPSPPSPQPLVEPLTNRELDILELLEQRLQTKEIATELCVSPETVKSHLRNIFQKLDAGNRREAVEKAKHLGII